MDTWRQKLGYYTVNGKCILNKAAALLEACASHSPVQWVFNDETYSKFNWSVPIPDSLPTLYKKRAQQLREKYDYLMLYFSGGGDSVNMLHAFIDNGIFIDEIVMQYPEPTKSTWNNIDLGNNNYFSEIKYAAVEHLQKIRSAIDSRTKVKFLDQCDDTIKLFNDPHWFEKYPLGTMITPAGAGRQISAIKDPDILKLVEANKSVCQVYGVDKPLVQFNDGQYFAFFRDANATHAVPTQSELGEIANKNFALEFFYWTPDLPEIVVKQAQEIKAHAQLDISVRNCLSGGAKIEHFRKIIHPIIYSPKALNIGFQTEKPSSAVFRPMDKWFWMPEFKQAQNNYLQVIKYLSNNIDLFYSQNGSIYNGLQSIDSKKYQL